MRGFYYNLSLILVLLLLFTSCSPGDLSETLYVKQLGNNTTKGRVQAGYFTTISLNGTDLSGNFTGAVGPQGAVGLQGASGPNSINTSTVTPLSGLLKGEGGFVAVANGGDISSSLGYVPGTSNVTLPIGEGDVTGLVVDLAGKVPDVRTVNGHSLTSNVTVTASDVGLGNVTNNAQVTSVSGTSPISVTAGTTPTVSIATANTTVAGSLSSADWNAFNAGWRTADFDAWILSDTTLVLYDALYRTDEATSPFLSRDHSNAVNTVTGATWSSLGYSFDGSNDNITVTRYTSLDIGTSDFTVLGWIKIASSAPNNNKMIVDKRVNSAPYQGYCFYVWDWTDKKVIHAQVNTGATTKDLSVTNAVSLYDDAWHLLGFSCTRSSATGGVFSVDGAQVGASQDYSSQVGTITNTIDLLLGEDVFGNYSEESNGQTIILNRALSITETALIYNATKWRYGY